MPALWCPDSALLGGACIGAAVGLKALTVGRPLGVSGTAGGLARGRREPWRLAHLAGYGLGAAVLAAKLPGAFEALPSTYTMLRAVGSGAAVGAGTALASGCTSGHGICGMARYGAVGRRGWGGMAASCEMGRRARPQRRPGRCVPVQRRWTSRSTARVGGRRPRAWPPGGG